MSPHPKRTAEHLARRAVVYVRQSTWDQVRFHRESQRRQYELVERARAMGFREVEVIDEALGRSGANSAGRPGFQRLVAAVCLGEVGAVFRLEASRLARNNRDGYPLVDLCALTATLRVDLEGVYDPRRTNDRLLLGLKGTMSEFELALFRQRALAARDEMARRGELLTNVPVGYVRTADNRCEKDPDRRVQHAIELVFRKFEQLGSIRQTLLCFRQENLPLPRKVYGPEGWRIEWKLPVYHTMHHILTNPTYAGAYAFGQTSTRTELSGQDPVKNRQRAAAGFPAIAAGGLRSPMGSEAVSRSAGWLWTGPSSRRSSGYWSRRPWRRRLRWKRAGMRRRPKGARRWSSPWSKPATKPTGLAVSTTL